jgi:hypothetical protein
MRCRRRNAVETAEQQRHKPQDHSRRAAAHTADRKAEQKNLDV